MGSNDIVEVAHMLDATFFGFFKAYKMISLCHVNFGHTEFVGEVKCVCTQVGLILTGH